jgi:hypothetical protein
VALLRHISIINNILTIASSCKPTVLNFWRNIYFVRLLDYNTDMTAMGYVRDELTKLPDKAFVRVADMRGGPNGVTTDAAIEQAFSRLARGGDLWRVGKGLYWKAPRTRFGPVPPPVFEAGLAIAEDRAPGPAGPSAAAFLGLTTQIPPVREFAVVGREMTKLRGAVFHERSNPKRDRLNPAEIAVLEIARDRLRYCEYPRDETLARLRTLAAKGGIRFDQLRDAVAGEARHTREFIESL